MARATLPASLVLDNEALQALANPRHPKHRVMLEKIAAVKYESSRGASVRVVTPTAVRVEALVSRRTPATAGLGRFNVQNIALDSTRADRCVALGTASTASAVDATVAEAAESEARTGNVSVYTSDVADLTRLVAHVDNSGRVRVRTI
jgi:hypothetical protein